MNNHLVIVCTREYLLILVVPSEREHIAVMLSLHFDRLLFSREYIVVDAPEKYSLTIAS